MRSILKAATALVTMAARGVGRTFVAMGQGALSVFDMIAQGLTHVVDLPFALVRALRPAAAPVPVTPAEAAAGEVMAALEEARRKGPEQIIAEGHELQEHIKANPPRKMQYDADAALKAIRDARAKAEQVLARSARKGAEASVIAHWARARVDGIAPDPAKGDLRALPEHLQVWARSLTPEQVAEVARMPRQMLHHHLTADDHKLWNATLPAASLDTAKRAMHGIRTAVQSKLTGTVDPYQQQAALDGIARKHELDAFKNFEYEPAAPRI